jgi:predicted DsbA family dithiol-disulfide isomerase
MVTQPQPQSTKSADDTLDGYRGRTQSADELIENEVRAIHEWMDNDVDVEAMRDIIRMDDLIAELNDESSTIRRLADYVTQRLDECSAVWQLAADPAGVDALDAHRAARAARLVLDWIQMTIEQGKQAERQLEVENE